MEILQLLPLFFNVINVSLTLPTLHAIPTLMREIPIVQQKFDLVLCYLRNRVFLFPLFYFPLKRAGVITFHTFDAQRLPLFLIRPSQWW